MLSSGQAKWMYVTTGRPGFVKYTDEIFALFHAVQRVDSQIGMMRQFS